MSAAHQWLGDQNQQVQDPGMFFEYEMGPVVLLAGGVKNSVSVQILDRDFLWLFATAVSDGGFTVLLKDATNKRQFANQQVHSLNLFGTSQAPMPILTPYLFRKRGSILADFTDVSGAPNTIRIAFIGVEIG